MIFFRGKCFSKFIKFFIEITYEKFFIENILHGEFLIKVFFKKNVITENVFNKNTKNCKKKIKKKTKKKTFLSEKKIITKKILQFFFNNSKLQ